MFSWYFIVLAIVQFCLPKRHAKNANCDHARLEEIKGSSHSAALKTLSVFLYFTCLSPRSNAVSSIGHRVPLRASAATGYLKRAETSCKYKVKRKRARGPTMDPRAEAESNRPHWLPLHNTSKVQQQQAKSCTSHISTCQLQSVGTRSQDCSCYCITEPFAHTLPPISIRTIPSDTKSVKRTVVVVIVVMKVVRDTVAQSSVERGPSQRNRFLERISDSILGSYPAHLFP